MKHPTRSGSSNEEFCVFYRIQSLWRGIVEVDASSPDQLKLVAGDILPPDLQPQVAGRRQLGGFHNEQVEVLENAGRQSVPRVDDDPVGVATDRFRLA